VNHTGSSRTYSVLCGLLPRAFGWADSACRCSVEQAFIYGECMNVKVVKPNPDGLDPVFQAYQLLRDYFQAAEIEQEVMKDENGEVCHVQEWIVLPIVGDAYPADDLDPLKELEGWLTRQLSRRLEDEA
jgi:hypothetical protein